MPSPDEDLPLQPFVSRQIRYSYRRKPIDLSLSRSLFSSQEIDAGTRMLLKTLAGLGEGIPRALDVGCGVGVIGLCLTLGGQVMRVDCQDRDALAVAMTQHNAEASGTTTVQAHGSLALWDLGDRKYDLIVSNLPAKAGVSVHRDIINRCSARLTPRGLCAVVVIDPLATRIAESIEHSGAETLLLERDSSHAVLHFRATEGARAVPETLEPYLRGRQSFTHPPFSYELDAVWNVAEFDTLSFATALALRTLASPPARAARPHRIIVWNPGQGHLPLALHSLFPGASITLAGRDLLQLRAAAHNLARAGGTIEAVHHTWNPFTLAGPFDLVILHPDRDPGVPWHRLLPLWARSRIPCGGLLLLSSTSTITGRFLREHHGLRELESSRGNGYRSVLLRRD